MASRPLALCQFKIYKPMDHILLGFMYFRCGISIGLARFVFDYTHIDHILRSLKARYYFFSG